MLPRLKGAGDTVHAGEDLLEEGETVVLGTPLTELLPEGGEPEPRSEQAPINVAAAHVGAPPSAVGGSSAADRDARWDRSTDEPRSGHVRVRTSPINVAAAHVGAPPSAVGGSSSTTSSARTPLTPKRVEAIAAERRRLWGTRVRARSRARTLRAGHSRCRASASRASSA